MKTLNPLRRAPMNDSRGVVEIRSRRCAKGQAYLAPNWWVTRAARAALQASLQAHAVDLYAFQCSDTGIAWMGAAPPSVLDSFADYVEMELAERLAERIQGPLWGTRSCSRRLNPANVTLAHLADVLVSPVRAGRVRRAERYRGYGTLHQTLAPLRGVALQLLFPDFEEPECIRVTPLPRYQALSPELYAELVRRAVHEREVALSLKSAA